MIRHVAEGHSRRGAGDILCKGGSGAARRHCDPREQSSSPGAGPHQALHTHRHLTALFRSGETRPEAGSKRVLSGVGSAPRQAQVSTVAAARLAHGRVAAGSICGGSGICTGCVAAYRILGQERPGWCYSTGRCTYLPSVICSGESNPLLLLSPCVSHTLFTVASFPNEREFCKWMCLPHSICFPS